MDRYTPLTREFTCPPGHPSRPIFDYHPTSIQTEPVVSIITAYYNAPPVFVETEAAVFGQSLQQWEWVIVDDNSTDELSLEMLTRVQARDPRVRVLRTAQNIGPGAARNLALEQSRGRYVFFLDADDLIEPTTLEELAWFLESYPEFAFAKGSTTSFEGQTYHATVNFEAGSLFLEKNPVTIMTLVRREALLKVGGFDASLVQGLEDWDLWLRLADHGYWGHGVPEFLDWYRRRPDHGDRWQSWNEQGLRAMHATLRQRYPRLFREGIPTRAPRPLLPYADLPEALPFANSLKKDAPRLLLIAPWMAMGGADLFNLNFLAQWRARGYQCSVVTIFDYNYAWYREYTRLTPDIFILPYFLHPTDYPRFLDYLIASRHFDIVMVSNSELGYKLLPYLRARHPSVTYVDYAHMEETYWNNGGYPRMGVAYQSVLDMNVVSSHHVKEWMEQRGANGEQIEVAYTNIDAERLHPDPELRTKTRAVLGIDQETPVLIYAGRICAQKQPRVFARVMRELAAAGHHFVCLVLGDGEDRRWLARYVRRYRLGRYVRLLGAVDNARMREFLAAADIFFLPSQMEGIALAIYEAMAMGLAIVGADVGGQKELVTPECGFLIQRGSVEDEVHRYAAVLTDLLARPEARRTMGFAARERIMQHFTLPQMGERMVDLLQRAQQRHISCPKPEVSLGLSREYTILALEEKRLFDFLQPLAKYAALEGLRGRISVWIEPLLHYGGMGRVGRVVEALRPIKDAVWIFGHRIKVLLGMAK